MLNLCSGPERPDGMDVFVRELGADIVTIDIVLSKSHDIVDEANWAGIRSEIEEGRYNGAGNAPVCNTLCGNRGFGPGPRSQRRISAGAVRVGHAGPDIIGSSENGHLHRIKVRGVLHAVAQPEQTFLFGEPEAQARHSVHFQYHRHAGVDCFGRR